jgi:transketolase
MGDLVGEAVDGELYYIKRSEFQRVAKLNAAKAEATALFADMARLNALYMIATAGSGHIGSSFSSMDLFAHLQLNEIDTAKGDKFFSSKGHDAPGLYAIMMAVGLMDEGLIHSLRRLDGLPGHPDVGTKGIVTNTGSLGMGIAKAKGMALAARLRGERIKVCVVLGDGELQEGQNWESMVSAANWNMGEVTVVVDHNKFQSDYSVERTSSLGDLPAKFAAFGWHVERIDGHDLTVIEDTFRKLDAIVDKPKVIIADTIKGKGVSFMEGTSIDSDVEMYVFHSGAPQSADYTRAAQELLDKVNRRAASLGGVEVEVERVNRPPAAPPPAGAIAPQGLFGAYSEALLAAARRDPKLVALDADLIKDMGLIPFSEQFADRFFECGIAEQDMVSMAGGMALSGLTPVVHSFTCFLATRPNEQIYNNATEHTKIVYVGGLSGVLPAGPGHSHQSVREISAIGGVPGLAMVAPSCPAEVGVLLDWCLQTHDGPSFIRMASLPAEIDWTVPAGWTPVPGQGFAVYEGGKDAVVIGSGPILLAQAVKAAKALKAAGIGVTVVNLPFLNSVDAAWLKTILAGAGALVTLDDHYIAGGHGEKVLAAMAAAGLSLPVLQLGLDAVPPSGQPAEVLQRLGLDAEGVAASVRRLLAR